MHLTIPLALSIEKSSYCVIYNNQALEKQIIEIYSHIHISFCNIEKKSNER